MNQYNISTKYKKYWLQAIQLALKGELAEAINFYERILNKYPKNHNLNYELSMIYIKVNNYQNAYNCMESIFEDYQNNINYLNDFSVVCTKLSYLAKAEYLSKKAFSLDPNNSNHLINLGAIYNLMENYDAALKVIEHAIQINPLEAKYYNLMGVTLVKNGIDTVAKKMFEVACALDNNYIEAKMNLAVLKSKNGDHIGAIQLFEELLTTSDQNLLNSTSLNQIKYFLSFDYLTVGRIQEGWINYEFGFDLDIAPNVRRNPVRNFNKPKWDGRVIPGKTLLVWREQGIGDEILFCSCLPDLVNNGMNIIVECENRLLDIIARSFPTFKVRQEKIFLAPHGKQESEDFDFQIPIGSLMRYYRNNIESFKASKVIFKVDEHLAAVHESNLLAKNSTKKRIGICWRSGLMNFERNNHYLVIEDLLPILQDKNFDFINLQYDDCEDELLRMEKLCEIEIIRWNELDLKNEINSILSLISRLDIVITVETAIAPMAASIGKQVIVICKRGTNNLGTDHYPAFPSVECIFPYENETLSDCMPRLKARLKEILK